MATIFTGQMTQPTVKDNSWSVHQVKDQAIYEVKWDNKPDIRTTAHLDAVECHFNDRNKSVLDSLSTNQLASLL